MTTTGLGYVVWWGYSPALDLINLTGFDNSVKLKAEHVKQGDSINILLIGAADLRHVLLTMANNNMSYKHIHFYIIESNLEVLARHMLFLSLIMESPDQLGYQEKTELFMELYGNVLMNSHALEYLKNKSNDLISTKKTQKGCLIDCSGMSSSDSLSELGKERSDHLFKKEKRGYTQLFITDEDLLKKHIPFLDISSLKFKERDFLEGILKFWRNSSDLTFDIRRMWENRVRDYLGVRYDHRSGVYDWDYNMKLLDLTKTVSRQEYCEWRDSGVAFKSRPDAPYESPNRTLASGIVVTKNGEKVGQRGYYGDIVNSPYVTFGSETDNKELLVPIKNQHNKVCQDIATHNISSLIMKLYGEKVNKSSSSAKSLHANEAIIEEEDENNTDKECTNYKSDNSSSCKFLETCTISLLPLGSASEIGRKKKFSALFDIVYLSNSMVHNLTSELHPVFGPSCSVIIESARFMLDLQKDNKDEYIKKVTAMALKVGLKPLGATVETAEVSSHLHFIYNNK